MSNLLPMGTTKKQLRPYQERALARLRASLGQGHRRVIFQLPTGGGKTLLASTMINRSLAKGNTALFTVPMTTLIDQTVHAFEAEGIHAIGVMQANHPRTDESQPVQVGTVQTLGRRGYPKSTLVIVDEAHRDEKNLAKFMDDNPGVFFIGLTATPWRKGMAEQWQDLVIAETSAGLIDQGYLCPFRVFAADHPDLSGIKTTAGDYNEGQLAKRMGQTKICADVIQTWLERGQNRPTLLFGVNKAHAAMLYSAFLAHGVSAAYIDDKTDRGERAAIGARFKSGDVKVVCSCRTLIMGVDWPVACIIDAAPTKSEMLHVQKIGRGLRINPPWEDCLILDHADNSLRLGFVTDIHHDQLISKADKSEKQSKTKEQIPKECKECGFLVPPKVYECPQCGYKAKRSSNVEVLDGELQEITPNGKPKPAKQYTLEEKQRFYSMALHLADIRNKPKLAKGLYKGTFGVWPHHSLHERRIAPDQAFMNYEKSRRIAYAKRMQKGREE